MSGDLSGVGLACYCALDGAVFRNMAAATVAYLFLLLLLFSPSQNPENCRYFFSLTALESSLY